MTRSSFFGKRVTNCCRNTFSSLRKKSKKLMQLEKESERLVKLVETGSTLPSLEELEGRIEKATRELDKKDDKIVVSLDLHMTTE